ncbi:hypothetical protein [Raoultella planticola]|uniref:hypothetical protein n=1 Tax=Raoultella planticola TaxID=575 RepID=UPI00045B5AC1|nr:hypothetical protein [Raoultella planticola]KAJ96860.1 hypothetical protein DF41_25060 [Raoultella planticola]
MNIINLEGFCQIPANREIASTYTASSILSALNEYGVTLITGITASSTPSSVQRSTQTVYGLKRTGLVLRAAGARIAFSVPLPDISKSAVQLGFRFTLGEGAKYSTTPSFISVGGYGFTTPYPTEAASYYYEVFVAWDGTKATAELYCNGVLSGTLSFTPSSTTSISVVIGTSNSYIFPSSVTGTLMLGDMYCATIAYNDENTAEASPLGSIEVKYSEVTQFEGGRAENSLGEDIIAGLNTVGSDAGYLMLGSSTDAAVATFAEVDNSDDTLIGVAASVTYRTSATPNNHLAWKTSCGSAEGAITEETELNADQSSWTTVKQVFMRLPGSEDVFGKGNLTFTASLYNRKVSQDNPVVRRQRVMPMALDALNSPDDIRMSQVEK